MTPDESRARIAELESALARAETWDGLIELLDKHYPPDVVTGESHDPGPRMIVLVREVSRLTARAEKLRRALEECIEEEAYQSYDASERKANLVVRVDAIRAVLASTQEGRG